MPRSTIFKRKWVRYLLRTVIVLVGLWLLALTALYIYITTNKSKIITSIKATISEKISGTVTFEDLGINFWKNFPGLAIDVQNLHIQDSLYFQHKKELLYVQHAYVNYSFFGLLRKNKTPKRLTLENGALYMYRDTVVNKNWGVFKVQGKKKLKLENLTLENMNVFFEDRDKNKFFNILFEDLSCEFDNEKDAIDIKMGNNSVIKKAGFNMTKGPYLANKKFRANLFIVYERSTDKIVVKNQKIRIDNHPYDINGNFYIGNDPHFDLVIKTTNLDLQKAAEIFPPKPMQTISKFKLSKPLKNLEAVLYGPMKYGSIPLAKVNFTVEDAKIDIPLASFDHCSFKGMFKNEIDSTKTRDDGNSYIQFTDITGEWEATKFESKGTTVYNLIEPYLRLDLHTKFELAKLEKAISSKRINLNSGSGEASIQYAGPLGTKKDTSYDLNGSIRINKANITYNPRNLHFVNTNIEFDFQNGDLAVRKMNTLVNGNQFNINGNVKSLLAFFNEDPEKATFNWNVYSPQIDISKLKSSLRRTAISKQAAAQQGSFFDKLNTKIDRLFDECNAYIDLKADKLLYKKFTATGVNGKIALTNNVVSFNDLSFNHAGGSMNLTASTIDKGNSSDLVLKGNMNSIDVKQLFYAFDNFGMQSLKSDNITGNITATLDINSNLDADNNLIASSNRGYVDFSLKNGRLVRFQPLMDINSNFLKKRNVDDISFAEIKNRLELRGNDIVVNRMEVQSTAIGMFIEGIYSFGNNTDLSIQLPFKYLKKRDEDYVPTNKGVDSKTGMGIFLRAKDKDGKIDIGYDPLGRFRNKDKK